MTPVATRQRSQQSINYNSVCQIEHALVIYNEYQYKGFV